MAVFARHFTSYFLPILTFYSICFVSLPTLSFALFTFIDFILIEPKPTTEGLFRSLLFPLVPHFQKKRPRSKKKRKEKTHKKNHTPTTLLNGSNNKSSFFLSYQLLFLFKHRA